MAYWTDFTLSIHEYPNALPPSILDVHEALRTVMGDFEIMFDVDETEKFIWGESTWYDHDVDCAELSKKFPGAVFKLHGEGEYVGDLWDSYYKDGLCQICRASITYPTFDCTKLKDVEEAQLEDLKNAGTDRKDY